MEPVRQIETSARGLAEMADAGRLIPPRVRDLAADRRVRNAAEATVKSGRKVWEQTHGSNPKDLAGRFARDRRLQEEALALLRSATKTVEQGRAYGRRRRRNRVLKVVAVVTGGMWLAVAGVRRVRRPTTSVDLGHRSDGQPSRQQSPAPDQHSRV